MNRKDIFKDDLFLDSILEKIDCINMFKVALDGIETNVNCQIFSDSEEIDSSLDDTICFYLDLYEKNFGCSPEWYS